MPNSTFEERLQRALNRVGMQKKDLASALGIVPQSLTRYKHGRLPTAEILAGMAVQLEVSADYLLGIAEDNPCGVSAAEKCEQTTDAVARKSTPFEALHKQERLAEEWHARAVAAENMARRLLAAGEEYRARVESILSSFGPEMFMPQQSAATTHETENTLPQHMKQK